MDLPARCEWNAEAAGYLLAGPAEDTAAAVDSLA